MFGGVGINQYAAAGFGAMNNAEETRKKTKAEGQSGKHASGNTALTASQDSHRETQMPQMERLKPTHH